MTSQDQAFATQAGIAREHGQRALDALNHIDVFMARAARLVARGRDWYESDHDEVPPMACEALIIKAGDAAARIPKPLRDQHPEIPWTLMSDMRNQLIHAYDVTDYEIVWDTIENDFPDVHNRLRAILGYTQPTNDRRAARPAKSASDSQRPRCP